LIKHSESISGYFFQGKEDMTSACLKRWIYLQRLQVHRAGRISHRKKLSKTYLYWKILQSFTDLHNLYSFAFVTYQVLQGW